MVFQRHFVAATIYQEPHFWKGLSTEPQELFAFLLDHKIIFHVESIAMHNLQEIQFMEFMGDLA